MLILAAKPNSERQHGNGIMYGGESKYYPNFDAISQQGPHDVFFVETDFGNHMKLSWTELTSMFDIVRVADYEK